MKLTKRMQRLLDYDRIMATSRKHFRAGSYLSRDQLITMFNLQGVSKLGHMNGTYAEQHRENLRLVAVQQDINHLLRANGLYMRSMDYYTSFQICRKEQTKNTIVRYAGQIERNDSCEVQLDAGMVQRVQAGTWGTYNRVYTNQGLRKAPRTTTAKLHREEPAKRRVKGY